MDKFRESLKVENYKSSDIDIKLVDRMMKMPQEELKKIPTERLNSICEACGFVCGGVYYKCKIGKVIHERDNDEVDITSSSIYNRHFPEL